MSKTVLFLCTGNYYRSRFAEILFNHLAGQSKLAWRADSRGLARRFRNLECRADLTSHAAGAGRSEDPVPRATARSDALL